MKNLAIVLLFLKNVLIVIRDIIVFSWDLILRILLKVLSFVIPDSWSLKIDKILKILKLNNIVYKIIDLKDKIPGIVNSSNHFLGTFIFLMFYVSMKIGGMHAGGYFIEQEYLIGILWFVFAKAGGGIPSAWLWKHCSEKVRECYIVSIGYNYGIVVLEHVRASDFYIKMLQNLLEMKHSLLDHKFKKFFITLIGFGFALIVFLLTYFTFFLIGFLKPYALAVYGLIPFTLIGWILVPILTGVILYIWIVKFKCDIYFWSDKSKEELPSVDLRKFFSNKVDI